MKTLVIAVVIAWCAIAGAGTPTMTTYDAKAFTVSVPKSWTVVADASKGMVVAQQDPKRKDAAQLLVMVSANTSATADQVLDQMLQAIANAKVIKRDPLPGGAGKLLVADGTVDGVKARLGAIAVANGSGVVVGMLISKATDFDGLGGTATVASVLGSIKAASASTAPTGDTAPPATSTSSEVMTPTYDSYNNLIVPPPRRTITQADMAGEWHVDNTVAKKYVSISTANHSGFSVTNVSQAYVVDAKGNMSSKVSSKHITDSGGYQHDDAGTGTFTISSDRTITIAQKGKNPVYYVVRGWFVGPDVTIMRANGPWYDLSAIPADIRTSARGGNLDDDFVRKTR
jgi:hypothetical protein